MAQKFRDLFGVLADDLGLKVERSDASKPGFIRVYRKELFEAMERIAPPRHSDEKLREMLRTGIYR